MTTYTLYGQPGSPATLASVTSSLTLGVEFYASEICTLTAIWFYSPPGAAALPGTIVLYQPVGRTLITSNAASWSGAAGSGWVSAAFSSPPALAANTHYMGCVFYGGGDNWYPETTDYFTTGPGSGGITSGILTAPSNSAAIDWQNAADNSGSLAFPEQDAAGSNFWIDIDVTTSGGTSHTATAALTVPPYWHPGGGPGMPGGTPFEPWPPLGLTGPASVTIQGAAALAGLGAVAANLAILPPGTASGGGTLNAPAVIESAATLAGGGTVSDTAILGTIGLLAGQGGLSAPLVLDAIATLAGQGGVAGTVILQAIAVLAGAGALAGAAVLQAIAVLAGQGAVTADLTTAPIAALAGAGAIAATAGQGVQAGGQGALAAPADIAAPAILDGGGTITPAAVAQAVTYLAGQGTLTALDVQSAVALLTGLGALTGTPGPAGPTGAATLAGAGQINPAFLTLVLGYARAGQYPIPAAQAGPDFTGGTS